MRLVLEGGGVRAAYSAGVLYALQGLPFTEVIGTSAGSVNAAFLASGRTEALCEMWRKMADSDFISHLRFFLPWGRPGLDIDTMIDEYVAPLLVDADIGARGMLLRVVATCLDQLTPVAGTPRAENLIEWLRASNAFPLGYGRVVEIEGQRLIDGGCSAPVAFDLLPPAEGPTVVVLTRKLATRKGPPTWWQRWTLRAVVKEPIRGLTFGQNTLHNETMRRLEAARDAGEVIVLDPPDDMVLGRLTRDLEEIDRGIAVGRREGAKLAQRLNL